MTAEIMATSMPITDSVSSNVPSGSPKQRREALGAAHYGQRRQQYRCKEPQRNERHPNGIGQVDKPAFTQGEEQGRGEQSNWEIPFGSERVRAPLASSPVLDSVTGCFFSIAIISVVADESDFANRN